MYGMTINGETVAAEQTFNVIDPTTGSVVASAPECSPAQLDSAMSTAKAAQRTWAADEDARRSAMRAIGKDILTRSSELVEALQLETGKPTVLASAEPVMCDMWLQYYADMELPREIIMDTVSAYVEAIHRPLGVVAAITPWNFPLALAMWKVAPALRAGNTVVLKPSPFAPLATMLLGQIIAQHLPNGVINVVCGGDELGAQLVGHPIPRKVSFTGSVSGGTHVARSAAENLRPVTLELGGNDAAIVLDDSDPEEVASKLLPLAFLNCGQACVLPKRIFVPQGRYQDFVDAFASVSSGMTTGDPRDEATQMGPLSNKQQYERVVELTNDARARGARIATGGKPLAGSGFFFEPTIVADVAEGVRIVDEEQFGPVLPIISYQDEQEAVERANNTDFGLGGSVWSPDIDRAAAVAEQLDVGTAYINTHGDLLPPIPFGGVKRSGLGVENGLPGLLSFTELLVLHRSKR
jgi:acyl-CoA reductase-like NAD-dependent aldehyde dehydrogenase